jgi:type II secretory pathway pseudopilin PulG
VQLRKLSQAGDTIVEVLIAIAVAGAVLGGAYSLINSNVKSNQLAQERSNAVKIAESQLEQLRSYVGSTSLPSGSFCFKENDGSFQRIPSSIPSTRDNDYPVECRYDEGSAQNRYLTGIVTDSSDPNTFTVYVDWDAPTGTRAQASIAYKVYK